MPVIIRIMKDNFMNISRNILVWKYHQCGTMILAISRTWSHQTLQILLPNRPAAIYVLYFTKTVMYLHYLKHVFPWLSSGDSSSVVMAWLHWTAKGHYKRWSNCLSETVKILSFTIFDHLPLLRQRVLWMLNTTGNYIEQTYVWHPVLFCI